MQLSYDIVGEDFGMGPAVMSEQELRAIGERFKELRTKAKLTQGEIAKATGDHQSIISDVERGYRRPSLDLLVWAARHFQVTVDYLLFGDGPDPSRGTVCKDSQSVPLARYKGDAKGLLTVCEQQGDICIPNRYYSPSIIAVECDLKGNEPIINPGGIVGIDKDENTIVSGEIYAFCLKEGFTICHAFIIGNKLLLKKEDPKYPESTLPLDEVTFDSVIGRVKWVIQPI